MLSKESLVTIDEWINDEKNLAKLSKAAREKKKALIAEKKSTKEI